MKKLDLGQAISILANVGVIAGIVFLATEIAQTNEYMAAQDRFNRLTALHNVQAHTIANADIALINARLNAGEELRPEEELAARMYQRIAMRSREWAYRELPENELPIEQWRRNFSSGYTLEMWSEEKTEYDPGFVDWIEENVLSP